MPGRPKLLLSWQETFPHHLLIPPWKNPQAAVEEQTNRKGGKAKIFLCAKKVLLASHCCFFGKANTFVIQKTN